MTDGADFSSAVSPMVKFITGLMPAVLMLVAAAGTLYCILLAVQYARASEPQEREKAKNRIATFLLGFVLIFILLFLMQVTMPVLVQWVQLNADLINGDIYK